MSNVLHFQEDTYLRTVEAYAYSDRFIEPPIWSLIANYLNKLPLRIQIELIFSFRRKFATFPLPGEPAGFPSPLEEDPTTSPFPEFSASNQDISDVQRSSEESPGSVIELPSAPVRAAVDSRSGPRSELRPVLARQIFPASVLANPQVHYQLLSNRLRQGYEPNSEEQLLVMFSIFQKVGKMEQFHEWVAHIAERRRVNSIRLSVGGLW